MEQEKSNSIPRLFVISSIVIGLLLAGFSIASGSNPLVQPDIAQIENQLKANPVTPAQLAAWTVEGKRDFQVAGFRSSDDCTVQKHTTRQFKCYDNSKINDTFWVRKTFRNINMPLIVYGTKTEDGLAAAVKLKHMGYDVRYLEEGFSGFAEAIMGEETPLSTYFAANDPLVKVKGQKWVIASANDAMEEEDEEVELGEDEEEEEGHEEGEDEDEEEEEGC